MPSTSGENASHQGWLSSVGHTARELTCRFPSPLLQNRILCFSNLGPMLHIKVSIINWVHGSWTHLSFSFTSSSKSNCADQIWVKCFSSKLASSTGHTAPGLTCRFPSPQIQNPKFPSLICWFCPGRSSWLAIHRKIPSLSEKKKLASRFGSGPSRLTYLWTSVYLAYTTAVRRAAAA